MKRKLVTNVLVAGVVVLFLAGAAFAAEMKIGVVDIVKIMEESNKGKDAKAAVEKKSQELQVELKGKKDKMDVMKNELDRERKKMSLSDIKKREDELQKLAGEYQVFSRKMNQDLRSEEIESRKRVYEEIKAVIDKFFNEEKYSIIFDKRTALAFDKATDLTEKIMGLYDKGK